MPMLSSNYLASISNCLEETENREALENQMDQNKSQPRNFSVLLLLSLGCKNAESQKVSEASHLSISPLSLFTTLASSADQSRGSMGINIYCYMMQMSLGMELECIGAKFPCWQQAEAH